MHLPRGKPLVLLLLSLGFLIVALPLLLAFDSPLGWIALVVSCVSTLAALTLKSSPFRAPSSSGREDGAQPGASKGR